MLTIHIHGTGYVTIIIYYMIYDYEGGGAAENLVLHPRLLGYDAI